MPLPQRRDGSGVAGDSDPALAGATIGSEAGVLNTPVGQIINMTAL